MHPFSDRTTAGRELALLLQLYRGRSDVMVLALPCGGVPVAFEIAHRLAAPLDVMVLDRADVSTTPAAAGEVPPGSKADVDPAPTSKPESDQREHWLRSERNALDIKDHLVVLVDDGAVTGARMQAAVRAARRQGAREIVVALPVAPIAVQEKLLPQAERVVCISTPTALSLVSGWYQNFPQVSDIQVRDLLSRARQDQVAG